MIMAKPLLMCSGFNKAEHPNLVAKCREPFLIGKFQQRKPENQLEADHYTAIEYLAHRPHLDTITNDEIALALGEFSSIRGHSFVVLYETRGDYIIYEVYGIIISNN